jgi:hypothetical protein
MRRLHLLLLLSCAAALGQSPPTFHISGTVLSCGKPYPGRIALESDTPKSSVYVQANKDGVYEADLPLGVYSVSAFEMSHPRRIRVTSPASVVVDIYLPAPVLCDLVIVTRNGKSPTPEQEADRTRDCYGEEYHSVPSRDGVPFEVDLSGLEPGVNFCPHAKSHTVHRQFATYNLFSVHADRVAYHVAERTIEAEGNVLFRDDTGEHGAKSATFQVQDGQVVLVHRDR